MLTAAAWGLAAILAGLLVLLLAIALHAWERTVQLEARLERLERALRLVQRRQLEEVEETVQPLAWWAAS